MGTGLADNVSQGGRRRSVPLAPFGAWGQRIFFLHDAAPTNLVTAINAHGSNESEANTSLNSAAP